MVVFRINSAGYIDDLSGRGAKNTAARWNAAGTAVLYTSSSIALATLEMLVHIPVHFTISDLVLAHIVCPEDSITDININSLPPAWNENPSPDELKDITDKWIRRGHYLVMKVPSAIVSQNHNYIINPAHKRFREVNIIKKEPFTFDKRILKNMNVIS